MIRRVPIPLALALVVAAGCAAPARPSVPSALAPWPAPPAGWTPPRVAVLPPSVSAADEYPALRDARVGLGVIEAVQEMLDDTGWFQVVAGDAATQEAMLRQVFLARSGVTSDEALDYGRALGADHVLIPVVSEFGIRTTRSPGRRHDTTRIRVQCRLVRVATWEETIASGASEHTVTTGEAPLVGSDGFRNTSVGEATYGAAREAVQRLVTKIRTRARSSPPGR